MKADTFVSQVMPEILKSPNISDTSFLRSSIKAIGRQFEARSIDAAGAIEAIDQLLSWKLSRDIKKGVERAIR